MPQANRIIDKVADLSDWNQSSFADGQFVRWDVTAGKFVGTDSTPGPQGDTGDTGDTGADSTVPGPKGDTGSMGPSTGTAVISFVDGDLDGSDNLLASHNLGDKYVGVQVYDENDELIIPTGITLTNSNQTTINLVGFRPS